MSSRTAIVITVAKPYGAITCQLKDFFLHTSIEDYEQGKVRATNPKNEPLLREYVEVLKNIAFTMF